MTKQSGETIGDVPIRAYTVKEIAMLYRVCKQTFRKWIKPFEDEIGERNGHFYTVKQVRVIIEKLGMPEGTGED